MNPLPTRNSQHALRRADFRSVPEMLDYAARGETGITFYNVRGEILSALAWRDVRERAHVVARRLIGAGFAAGERILITADTWPGFFDAFFGAQYAGLLPVPVSIPGRDRRQGRLSRPAAPPARRVGRGGGGGRRRSRRFPGRRRPGIPRRPPAWRHGGDRGAAGEAGRSAAARAGRPLLHPVLLGQHAPSARRADHAARPDGQSRRHDRPGRPRCRRGRPRRELAAALSRHGPDRLPDGAALAASSRSTI